MDRILTRLKVLEENENRSITLPPTPDWKTLDEETEDLKCPHCGEDSENIEPDRWVTLWKSPYYDCPGYSGEAAVYCYCKKWFLVDISQ